MKRKSFLGSFFVVVMLVAIFVGSSYAETITFGVYTSDKPSVMYKQFKPIVDYLQKKVNLNDVNIEINMKIYASYSGAVDALVQGDVDFVRFGPASYILAKEKSKDIRLLAMEHKKNKKKFNGVFIVAKDSPVKSLKELKGKSFAFGNKNSTIGRYLSQAELVEVGIRATDLRKYEYLGRHDKVALAVAVGNYDAGVVKENTYKKYADSKGLKKIAEFPNVTKPWVVRAGLEDNIFAILQKALLALTDKDILKSLKQDGFLIATDEDYDFVRKGMELSKKFGEKD